MYVTISKLHFIVKVALTNKRKQMRYVTLSKLPSMKYMAY